MLLDRTPAFALDMLYYFELPDDVSSEQLSELGSDLEYSDLPEKSLCRIVFGPSKIRLCSGSLHRIQMVQHSLAQYDYPPYYVPTDNPIMEGQDNADRGADGGETAFVDDPDDGATVAADDEAEASEDEVQFLQQQGSVQ